ncbi:ADP-glyceromanno-heptose 6-epimerase [Acidomonas methanolica]|uniref:ADP-glyceromanno-heptose 6-epimerase n=1 Tax=Acidomonas methanolica TaxID=437 RepID=UPI00211A8869|nr:ADP-glyceromanno-heptose 6-epimerase [Acidomonas methanolica]MCQ9155774.1 ADP-glyceromanno-heptose 6-epimerase [Acidomonas methanolica]
MIIVTGGAGFIGSCLHAALKARGERTAVVDRLRDGGKWRNLARAAPDRLVAPEDLDAFLAAAPDVRAVFHMGAISATTARDGDLVWRTNVDLSEKLMRWCAARGVRFIYASSAATYGAADRPEQFSDAPDGLDALRPLNLYGWSKQVFDQHVLSALGRAEAMPPQWAGLKFFNVYGPNEYHKGGMISVVKVKYDEVARGEPARLFRSDRADIPDGEQKRDFVWVGDVVDVLLWLYEHPHVSGLFNLGTGTARSYLDLAHAVCDAAGRPRAVEFIDMPEALRGQYQCFTCADLTRLRAAGYERPFTSLEEGVAAYVREYLATDDPFFRYPGLNA